MEVLGWRSSDNNLPATSIFAESPRGIFSAVSNQMLCTMYSDMLVYKCFLTTTIHAKSRQILIKGMFFVRLFLSQVDQRSAFKYCARYFYHSMEGARMKKFLWHCLPAAAFRMPLEEDSNTGRRSKWELWWCDVLRKSFFVYRDLFHRVKQV